MSKRRAERALAGAAMLFAALGDQTRLAVVQRLSRDGPASISTLADDFTASRQSVTKHLHVLEAAGVIHGQRLGREHVWTLNPERLADAVAHLDTIGRGWDAALSRLKVRVERG